MPPFELLRDKIPALADARMQTPCGCVPAAIRWGLVTIIIHLNDTDRWSRDKIADWLEGLDIDLTFQVDDDE